MFSEDDDDLVAVCNQVKTSKEYVIIVVGVQDNILAVEVSATLLMCLQAVYCNVSNRVHFTCLLPVFM